MKQKTKIRYYFDEFKRMIDDIEVFDLKRKNIGIESAVNDIVSAILRCKKSNNTIFFVGNGGSASIANHMATDFIKNGEMRCLAFSDASLITCVSNDLGYEQVFAKPIEQFLENGDILFAISSSGESANILNSVDAVRKKRCLVITLSGFSPRNKLSRKGDLNIYVGSNVYSHVEIMHMALCHYITDIFINR